MSIYNKTKKTNIKNTILITVIIVSLIAVLYISNDKNAVLNDITQENFSVEIHVSRNYHNEVILSDVVQVQKGENIVDLLKSTLEIKTSYSGQFIESINDLKSTFNQENSEKNDWFYYVNGILSPFGAAEYYLHPNDIIRWDYHNWETDRVSTAIIADFPEPFVHGFHGKIRSTIIVYNPVFYNESYALKQYLTKEGVEVELRKSNGLTNNERTNNNLIIIDNVQNQYIKDINLDTRQIGIFIEYKDEKIFTYNQADEIDNTYESAGFIYATQNIYNSKGNWNGENVIWVISGVKNDDVKESLDIILHKKELLRDKTSLIIYNDTIKKVP